MKYILYILTGLVLGILLLTWVLLCLTIRFLWDFKLASFEMIVLGPMRIWDWLKEWWLMVAIVLLFIMYVILV